MSIADSSYPLLNAFWTMFEFFLWVIWILIMVFIDIFRSHDLSGRAKALWFLFVLFILLLGVLVYLIARGGKMHDRAAQQARQQDAEARAYIQQVAASSPASTADQLTKLADLHDRGSSPLRSSNARRPRPKSWRPHSVRTRGSVCGRARRIRSSSARAHRAGIQPSRGKGGRCDHRWPGRASLDGDALAPAHPLRCGWPEGGYTSAVEPSRGSNFFGLGRIAMSAPSLKPDQPSRPYPSGRYAPGRSTRHKLGKPAGTLALITGGLAGLIIGIGIGNAARKRIDKWGHGYP